jgi:cation-transporting ATPase 13A1
MPHVKVFARVSPKQKEQVIIKLNNLGFTTLMCGDGTNDVAALKHAHVGVALLTGVAAKRAEQQQENPSTSPSPVQPPQVTTVTPQQQVVTPAEAANRAREQAKKRLEELYKQMDENEQTIVRLGDASIAAPFTSRTSTIQCVCHIIKQGRCTLVTTLQMFKILALNALILAYSLSVLYLDGIKFSDGQHTLQGLLLAGCFLFISRSQPLKTLARERPLPNIFNLYTLISVLGQFAIHLTALIYVVNEAHKRIPPRSDEFADLEAEFSPNLVNSTVYIMSITLQIATFAVNYQGHPFMESLRGNKPLLYSIFFSFTLVISLIFNLLPQLTEQFQIVLIPDDMRLIVFFVVLGDVILAYIIDRVLAYFLGQAKLKQY